MNSLFGKIKHYGMKRSLSYILGELKVRIIHRHVLGSYSQSKEDLMLDKLLGYKQKGFYVDIGAYDPMWLSNTLRFYRRGWRGINIEPSTDHWQKFVGSRPRDINLNIGIGQTSGTLTYFAVDPSTLSTFSRSKADEYRRSGLRVLSEQKIAVEPLSKIFAEYAGRTHIDFMSLDVEGFEIDVLKSNNWKKYRPAYICSETASEDGDWRKTNTIKLRIGNFMKKVGYTLVWDNGLNSFYKDMRR